MRYTSTTAANSIYKDNHDVRSIATSDAADVLESGNAEVVSSSAEPLLAYLDAIDRSNSALEEELKGETALSTPNPGDGEGTLGAQTTRLGAAGPAVSVMAQTKSNSARTVLRGNSEQFRKRTIHSDSVKLRMGSSKQQPQVIDDVGRISELESEISECNATINRHLSFIDRLIKDKKQLADRNEGLIAKLAATEKQCHVRLQALKEGHAVELRRQKDIFSKAEKSRREKWVSEQTKRIKQMTIKGLEPEIQRMVREHKAEIVMLKETHNNSAVKFASHEEEKTAERLALVEKETEQRIAAAVKREHDDCLQRFQVQVSIHFFTLNIVVAKMDSALIIYYCVFPELFSPYLG